MIKKTKSQRTTEQTLRAARAVSRRSLLKGAAVTGAVVGMGPWYIKKTMAAGELNVMMWSDYLPQEFMDAFKAETGITINHTGIGSNEEILNKIKATKGRGFDLISPTGMRALQWEQLGVLQPFDMDRIPTANLNPSMLAVGYDDWNFGDKGSHWVPQLWGTEALSWRTDKWTPTDLSYGDLWSEEMNGKVMGRPHSMMLGAGLYLETAGTLEPGDMKKAYTDEATMRPIWQTVTDFVVAKKDGGQLKKFWNDADGQKTGFMQEDVVLGQTWDGPILAMKGEGLPVAYVAPKEGALAWIDGIAMPVGAKNTDEIYAFLEFSFRPDMGGLTANKPGYNSAVVGSDEFLSEQSVKNFQEAYPGSALENLWAWPPEPVWYAQVRNEYRDRFVAA